MTTERAVGRVFWGALAVGCAVLAYSLVAGQPLSGTGFLSFVGFGAAFVLMFTMGWQDGFKHGRRSRADEDHP